MADVESVAWRVQVGQDETSAAYDAADPVPSGGPRVVFACAHGAGGSMGDRANVAACAALRARGIGTVRFNFLYTERGSRRPDPMPRCMDVVAAVAERIRRELAPELLIIGGRSMGGRAASMLAAEGFAADGLLLLAYPLHPAGKPETLRDAHLPSIRMPVLCFNGTRDELCRPDLMEQVLTRVGPNWRMHWLEAADHSFHVLKKSGRTDAQVLDEFAGAARDWMAGLRPASARPSSRRSES